MAEKLKNNQQGFTMVEMLVSIFIIALISGIFLTNYRSYGKSGDLNMVAQKLASDIRLMQNYTLGLKDYNGSISNNGWGIYMADNAAEYILFLDGYGAATEHIYDSAEKYKTINLPVNYSLTTATVNPPNNSGTGLSIVFEPPNPTGWICRVDGDAGSEEAVLTLSNGAGLSKTITVNKYGLIDILN